MMDLLVQSQEIKPEEAKADDVKPEPIVVPANPPVLKSSKIRAGLASFFGKIAKKCKDHVKDKANVELQAALALNKKAIEDFFMAAFTEVYTKADHLSELAPPDKKEGTDVNTEPEFWWNAMKNRHEKTFEYPTAVKRLCLCPSCFNTKVSPLTYIDNKDHYWGIDVPYGSELDGLN